jgi:hypothetical protein
MTKAPNVAATARHRPGFRLERWHRRGLYAAGLVLLASGVAWMVLHYAMRPVSEYGETVHPLEPWTMKLHGAAAMAALFLVGGMVHLHIRRAHKAGHNRFTGWAMIATMLFLAVSGYGLYYVAGEADRPVWSVLHWVVGLAAAVLFVAHIVIGRKSLK